jgi:hypothetical protein
MATSSQGVSFHLLHREMRLPDPLRYGAAKPTVRGIEKNKVGEPVIDGNIHAYMLPHLYMVEKT